MSQCPFLSTREEKVSCFKGCSMFTYEANGDGCPFKKIKARRIVNIKDIISMDYAYHNEDENDSDFVKHIYSKNHYLDEIV